MNAVDGARTVAIDLFTRSKRGTRRFPRFFFEKRVPDIIAASEDKIQHGGSTTSEKAKKNV